MRHVRDRSSANMAPLPEIPVNGPVIEAIGLRVIRVAEFVMERAPVLVAELRTLGDMAYQIRNDINEYRSHPQ